MSFPVTLNPSDPAQSESPSLGASRIRAIVQNLLDLFNLTSGVAITYALSMIRIGPATNNTGVSLDPGDIVTIDTGADSSVVFGDTAGSFKQFAVTLDTIPAGSGGTFGTAGSMQVNVFGAVTRGHYLQKSAATGALEDTGTAQADGTAMPAGACGIATQSFAGPGSGLTFAIMFGFTKS